MSKLGDRPAFPLPMAVGPAGDLYDASQTDPGLTVRQLYAGIAMHAFVSWSLHQPPGPGDTKEKAVARYGKASLTIADALINALESETDND